MGIKCACCLIFFCAITMTSHECHGPHGKSLKIPENNFDVSLWSSSLFNNLFRLTRKETSMLLALCKGNPPVTGGFPSQRASNVSAAKLNFWSTHPKTDVPYMFYTKFHSPRPIFYLPSSKYTHIGNLASVNFPHWMWIVFPCDDVIMKKLESETFSCNLVGSLVIPAIETVVREGFTSFDNEWADCFIFQYTKYGRVTWKNFIFSICCALLCIYHKTLTLK